MTTEQATGFAGLYFATKERFYHFLFKVALVLVLAQQIYFPQELKYFHLALLLMYFFFKTFFTTSFQRLGEQAWFLGLVSACSLFSVLQSTGILASGMPYLVALISANLLAMNLMARLFQAVRNGSHVQAFVDQHQLKTARDRKFTLVLSGLVIATLVLSLGYQGYELFKI